MSDKQERRDLAIIVTRLSAVRGDHDDEFLKDWDSSGKKDFIDLNPTGNAGPWSALIIHGCIGLFGCSSPNLVEEVVSKNLQDAGIDHSRFTHLWFLVHGTLPDGRRLDENTSPLILGEIAHGKTFYPRPYSGEGQPSASLGLLNALKRAPAAPDGLFRLISEKLVLRPVVENIAREMQELLLELRLWLDCLREDPDNSKSVKDRLGEIASKLEDGDHLNAPPMKKVLTYLLGDQGEGEWPLKALTYATRLDDMSTINKEISAFVAPDQGGADISLRTFDGRLAPDEDLLKISDKVIRGLAARLDIVVECASQMDRDRRKVQP